MTEYLLGKIEDFPEGKGRAFRAGTRTVAVFRTKDGIFAIANRCIHKGASVCEGEISENGTVVRCPWHRPGVVQEHAAAAMARVHPRHQGALRQASSPGRPVIYVLEGKGYSVVEGERKDWEKGDLVLLPMKPGGVEHQHFNADPSKPAIWAAFINIPIQEYLASDLKQEEVSPDFKEGQ
jgi:quercetin dioxygenase-like cupin family protein